MLSRPVRLFLSTAGALLLTLLLGLALTRSANFPLRLPAVAAGPAVADVLPAGAASVAVSEAVTISLPFVNKPIEPIPAVLLGTLPAPFDYSSVAVAINDRGQIIGDSYSASDPATNARQSRAFLWQGGVMTGLGTLGGPSSSAVAINERGEIVGTSTITDGGPLHAFVWANGIMTDVGMVAYDLSAPPDINNLGQVAGATMAADGSQHAFIWASGVMTSLGTLGGSMSRALDINDRGQVAGSSTTAGEQYEEHAFVWADGVMTDLRVRGSIPGASDAVAINERSQIAGRAGGNGFLWENGSATYFGSWPSNPITRIDDLNDAGEVVGYLMSGIESDAFVWSRGVLTPLKTFAASPLCPLRIDNAGAIVAIDWKGAFILRDGVRARLAAPAADSFSCARALNERGGVVGSVRTDFGRQGAALWETGE